MFTYGLADTFNRIWERNKKDQNYTFLVLGSHVRAMDAFMWCYKNVGNHIQNGREVWAARISEDGDAEFIFHNPEDAMRFKLIFLGEA